MEKREKTIILASVLICFVAMVFLLLSHMRIYHDKSEDIFPRYITTDIELDTGISEKYKKEISIIKDGVVCARINNSGFTVFGENDSTFYPVEFSGVLLVPELITSRIYFDGALLNTIE